jgi:hypothetical protein
MVRMAQDGLLPAAYARKVLCLLLCALLPQIRVELSQNKITGTYHYLNITFCKRCLARPQAAYDDLCLLACACGRADLLLLVAHGQRRRHADVHGVHHGLPLRHEFVRRRQL